MLPSLHSRTGTKALMTLSVRVVFLLFRLMY